MDTNININYNDYENIIHSIRSTGLSRKMSFIEKLIRKGFIVDQDGEWKEEWADSYISQLNIITENLEVAYGDNWDLHFIRRNVQNPKYDYDDAEENGESYNIKEYLTRFFISPIVRYKKLTITNSENKSQEINDLIVFIPLYRNTNFTDFNFKLMRPRGTRYSYTYEQFQHGYIHSHLEKRSMESFHTPGNCTKFCVGDGEIEEISMEISSNGFDEGLFGLYLTMLDTLVSWESIEGTPHVYMSKIVSKSSNIVNHGTSILNQYYAKMMTYFKSFTTEFKLNYVFNEGRYRIKQDSLFEKTIRTFIENYDGGYLKHHFLVKEENNIYYGLKANNTESVSVMLGRMRNRKNELPCTIIAGRRVEVKVKPFTGKEPDESEYKVYPKFKQYVAKELESELYEKAVTSSAIATRTELNNA